ncbi:N-acetylmuramoyl-L-alanine amidase [Amycolatopsis cynarae]|uniref:N-acetylmuramoyl-L-alanine amidase n=1 Tax=Amycolatopsis cynarae TaxID=2995223 RepID=A0ABY7AV73_9PSEU|nr:N-acetylmuramoyl-L-alanine amidase [Amycolatopsis sp. HUAS 11-8]WAL63881.1 N-acetylmuramoyl-L-alanine amidase [Amycolatopsis sp. HUAS 11-8]
MTAEEPPATRRAKRLWWWVPPCFALAAAGVATTVVVMRQPAHHPPAPAPAPPVPVAVKPSSAPATPAPLSSGEFAPGACVVFPPTTGDRGTTVFLDAGHGGPDPGAIGSQGAEKDLTLPVVLDAAAQLRQHGFRVVLSRTTDTSILPLAAADLDGQGFSTRGKHTDMEGRLRCANRSGAAALVSVHFDSYSDSSVRGATTLYNTGRPFAQANQRLATLLQQNILAALAEAGRPVPDRGIGDDTATGGGQITPAGEAYGHLMLLGPASPGWVDEPSGMPGALVEPLFLSNPRDAATAADPAGQAAIATGIARAVEAALTTR